MGANLANHKIAGIRIRSCEASSSDEAAARRIPPYDERTTPEIGLRIFCLLRIRCHPCVNVYLGVAVTTTRS
jgi:hypothetical protein